jgi:hypothetical protein
MLQGSKMRLAAFLRTKPLFPLSGVLFVLFFRRGKKSTYTKLTDKFQLVYMIHAKQNNILVLTNPLLYAKIIK